MPHSIPAVCAVLLCDGNSATVDVELLSDSASSAPTSDPCKEQIHIERHRCIYQCSGVRIDGGKRCGHNGAVAYAVCCCDRVRRRIWEVLQDKTGEHRCVHESCAV